MLKNGKKSGNEFFSVYTAPCAGKPRFFTANIAKKTLKKSSDRNRYKRWIRAAYHKNKSRLDGCDTLIMPRPGLSKLHDFKSLEQALSAALPGKTA